MLLEGLRASGSWITGVSTFEVTPDAVQRWQEMLSATAVDRREFERECTPSYLNNEG